MAPDDPPSSRNWAWTRAVGIALAASAALYFCTPLYKSLVLGDAQPSFEPDPGLTTERAPMEPAHSPPPRPSADRPPPAPARDPAVRRKLKLGLRGVASAGLAFGKNRLGVLGHDEIVVREGRALREVVRIPARAARAVVGLADGGLAAVGGAETLRLHPHDKKPLGFGRLAMLPDSLVFADRADPERLWVLPARARALTAFRFDPPLAGFLPSEHTVELDGFDRRSIGSVRDGSFLYTRPDDFASFHGVGQTRPVAGPAKDVARLLPASRPDTMWLVPREGEAVLHRMLAGKLYRVLAARLSGPVFDAAADGDLLAVLELEQPGDAPWKWVLEVFDVTGKRLLFVPFSAESGPGDEDEWVRSLMENQNLAVSADLRVVAVGGPDRLKAWDLDKGESIPTDG